MIKLFRKFKDLEIRGKKAQDYDQFTQRFRLQELRGYAQLVTPHIGPGAQVLELASGPGYFCIELAKLGGFAITGLDLSPDFVAIARQNAQKAQVQPYFVQGNAAQLQFEDQSFDFVFSSWSVKNFRDPQRVLTEIYRVLKPGGTALLIDLNPDVTAADWSLYAASIGISGMISFFMKLAFKIQRSAAYTQAELAAFIQSAGFKEYDISKVTINLHVLLTKSGDPAPVAE